MQTPKKSRIANLLWGPPFKGKLVRHQVIPVMEHDYYEGSETLSEDIINCESDEEGADEYDEDNRIQAAGT